MSQLIERIRKEADGDLGEFTSALFHRIKWDKEDQVIVGGPVKPAKVSVRIQEGADLAYAEQCAKHFNQLSPEMIDQLCAYSLRHCHSYCDYFGEDRLEIRDAKEMLSYVEPFFMYVTSRKNNEGIGYTVELHCDWDPEHGLSWIIRNEEILYVGEGMVHYRLGVWEDLETYRKNSGNCVFAAPKWA